MLERRTRSASEAAGAAGGLAAWSFAILLVACGNGDQGAAGTQRAADTQAPAVQSGTPDEPPVMVNREPPFRYPAPLYARRVQGNVTLRLFVSRDGRALADSTRVEETSGYPSLDSAAVKGSQELQFIPAKLRGEPMGVVVLFPVYFRHPEAAPLPGDSIIVKRAPPTTRPASPASRP